MKEISKSIIRTTIFLLIIICMGVIMFSCFTTKTVRFENESFKDYPKFVEEKNYIDGFVFSRLNTVSTLMLSFHIFTETGSNPETLIVENIKLEDKNAEIVFESSREELESGGFRESSSEYYITIYLIELDSKKYDRKRIVDKKNKYFNLSYDIDGKKYYERLERAENFMFITQ